MTDLRVHREHRVGTTAREPDLHGATPEELAPVVEAYGRVRPAGVAARATANPGRFRA